MVAPAKDDLPVTQRVGEGAHRHGRAGPAGPTPFGEVVIQVRRSHDGGVIELGPLREPAFEW